MQGISSLFLKKLEGATMPVTAGGRKILVVDDESAVADTLALIFKSCGYEARSAHSAEEAIELISTWQPDAAILDVMLPHMNGIEFGIVLKSNYPSCRVVLVSGHPGTQELLEIAHHRGHDFDILAKPLHPDLILDIVSSLLPGTPGSGEA